MNDVARANAAIEAELDPTRSQDAATIPELQIKTLADVVPEQVSWLWPRRIPNGKVTILSGDPGLGKSFLSLDIAARVSLGGPWPDDGTATQGDVLIVSAEDGLADTIRPRLDLLGADTSRIHAIGITLREGEKEVGLSLADHLVQIEAAVIQHRAILLIIDPLLAFTGRRTDTYKTSEVRPLLAAIASMAERTGCAILAIMHLNKRTGEGSAIYRISASLDFAAAARSVLLVGMLPNDLKKRALVSVKSNLSAPPEAISFHFTEDGCFAWGGVVDVTVQALLAPPQRGDEEASVRDEPKAFLREVLASGPLEEKTVRKEANEKEISKRTLDRAKAELEVKSYRLSESGKRGAGRWYWQLPEDQGCQSPSNDSVGNLDHVGILNNRHDSDDDIHRYDPEKPLESLRTPGSIKDAKDSHKGIVAPLIPEDVLEVE